MTIVAAYANRESLALKIKSVYAPAPPKPAPSVSEAAAPGGSFSGDAPWALSALPECFTQIERATGPRAYVMTHLPSGARRVSASTTVSAADCRVFLHDGAIWVYRGRDRLRIPPPAALYEATAAGGGETLTVVRGSGRSYDLRTYDMTKS